MEGEHRKNRKIRNDIIFIAALLAVVCLIGVIYIFTRAPGDKVTVKVNGKLFGEYPLSEDRIVEIKHDHGVNVLIIEGGKAYMAEASCPDGICVAHRPISRDGESIACRPNTVIITVYATGDDSPDIII